MRRFGGGSREWPRLTESIWPLYAERAIFTAFASFDSKMPDADQICDLADAIDAYADGKFYIAKALAEGALHQRGLERAKRQPVRRSLSELRSSFLAQREKSIRR